MRNKRLNRRRKHREGRDSPSSGGGRRALPSYSQQQLWIFEQLHPGTGTYNVPDFWRLRGVLNTQALESAVEEVVRRHEVLRTVFTTEGEQAVQRVREAGTLKVTVEDLSGVEVAQREGQARRLAEEEEAKPFDLSEGPLFRARLLRLGPEEHWLLLNAHHAITDGWSVGVMQREIGEWYRAKTAGEAAAVEELPLQYGDYAAWQQGWQEREVFPKQLEYWRARRGISSEAPA